nr:MAG: putative coat protein [Tombusviridae sp.]
MARKSMKKKQQPQTQSRRSTGIAKTSTRGGLSQTPRDTVTMSTAPVAKSLKIRKQSKPKQKNIANGVVITHSEMLASVITHGTTLTYNCTSLVANPGRSVMFPWLSTIAANYDKYRFRKLNVSFVTNQATSTAGKVGLGFDYDSTDPVPGDRIEFFALTHHVEGAVWDSLTLPIPCDKQLRFTNTHTTTDSKLIDMGQVLVMTDQVVATNANIGDVIVDYEVELIAAQQAIFSTQVALNSNTTPVVGLDYYSTGQQAGPFHFTFKGSTSAALEVGVSQGYYIMHSYIQDTGSAGGVTIATSGATTGVTVTSTGRQLANKYTHLISLVKCVVPTGTFIVTAGSNLVSCENVMFLVSRVSPAVYNRVVAGALD